MSDLRSAFSQFPERAAAELARLARVRHWHDGEVVLHGGSVVDSVVVVLDGRLRLTASSLEGEEILFRWFMPGEFVGLSSAVGNLPFLVDARAVGDCRTANIGRSAFLQVLAGDAEAALSVARQVSQFAHAMTQLVIARSEHTLTARVYSVLQRLAKHNATERTNGEIALHFSQNDIAMAVGASRARVNLELHTLETMGRIHLRYKHIILLDAGRATGE